MKKTTKILAVALALVLIVGCFAACGGKEDANVLKVGVQTNTTGHLYTAWDFGEDAAVAAANSVLGDKALAAAIAVGLAAAAGAVGMGIAVAKATEAISRQPEAENKIRTTLMLGLVFVETAIIYALVIAILIIFVL